MREPIKDFGYILKSIDYGEKDRILNILTKNHGKIACFALGAKKSKKRFGQGLDIGNRLNLIFTWKTKNNLKNLNEIRIDKHFDTIRRNLDQFGIVSYALELIDLLTAPDDPNPNIYKLLDDLFTFLPNVNNIYSLLLGFELKLFLYCGFLPDFRYCVRCNKITKNNYYFYLKDSNLLCEECVKSDDTQLIIITNTLKIIINKLILLPLLLSGRIVLSKEQIKIIRGVLDSCIYNVIGKKPKSHEFLNYIQNI